jgi:DNA-binding NtrC family response regulator
MTCKKTILCVDDEHSLSIHKLTLETRGYRVLAVSDAASALALLRQGGVDMVLSSAELPDGDYLACAVKSCAPQIPVVLLGSNLRNYHTDAPVELLLHKGAYAPAELLEHIKLLLVKRRGPKRQVLLAHRKAAS